MAGVVYDQADLDACFADLEHLLAAERPECDMLLGSCVNCGGSEFMYSSMGSGHTGARVCDTCGVVQPECVFWETMYGLRPNYKNSNYKRIHHWHERISQLLLLESQIPHEQMVAIGERLCDGTYPVINKDSVRAVLRSLNLQIYIEKWLQIIFRLTGISPPVPGPSLVQQLDELFQELQVPFANCRSVGRKNFLNYNYVFCRLFQRLDCTQFCMFFPLIKSKAKLQALDDMWERMTRYLGWSMPKLVQVIPFAVKSDATELWRQRLCSRSAPPVPVGHEKEPWRKACQRLDRHAAKQRRPLPEPLRLYRPEPKLQKLGSLKRRRV